jgi:hypothetical protein
VSATPETHGETVRMLHHGRKLHDAAVVAVWLSGMGEKAVGRAPRAEASPQARLMRLAAD